MEVLGHINETETELLELVPLHTYIYSDNQKIFIPLLQQFNLSI
jgi:hypothetical protein